MSILQEYEKIKRDMGEEKWNAIDKYIETQRPDLRLDEIIYKAENWIDFEKWFYERTGKNVDVVDVWLYEDDEYRASIEIGEGNDIGTIIVSYNEKDIRNLIGDLKKELSTTELKNAFAIFTLRNFDSFKNLPKISEASDLLREVYDMVKDSDGNMCFITYDDWKECFAEDYSNVDFETLKEEVKKFNLYDCIAFDEGDCKIIGYADLETAFIDDRKEPVKELSTLDFLNEEKEMILHNISCYSDGRFISKARKGYERQFAKEQQKLVIIERLINEERQKSEKYEDRER